MRGIKECDVAVQMTSRDSYIVVCKLGTKRKDIKAGTLLRITGKGLVYPTRQVAPKRGRPKKKKRIISFIGTFLKYA